MTFLVQAMPVKAPPVKAPGRESILLPGYRVRMMAVIALDQYPLTIDGEWLVTVFTCNGIGLELAIVHFAI